METNQSSPNSTTQKSKFNSSGISITIKVLILFVMLLILQIPILMIRGLIDERQDLGYQSENEIVSSWGSSTYFTQARVDVDDQNYPLFDLNVKVDVSPQELKRGIFTTVVYDAKVAYTIAFTNTVAEIAKPKGYPITYFKIPISEGERKGAIKIAFNGEPINEANATVLNISSELWVSIGGEYIPKKGDVIEITYNMNGSKELVFGGFNGNTTIDVNSTWTSPNFNGALLPDKRTVSENGFTAQWVVSNNTSSDTFGVELINSVDHYRLTDRATKYALLFIALTFLAFFVAETVNKWRIHPVQYALVGAAMVVFYSLLLSFSEQVGFGVSYLISSAATIMLISLYAITILRKNIKSAIFISILLTVLYMFLYFILQMEDYALIAGSVLLFMTIATSMFCLRNVKWYGENEQ